MRVLHIAPGFYPAHYYGGPIQSTYDLCRYLRRRGCEVRVLTTDTNGPAVLDVEKDREVEVADGVRVRYARRWMREAVSPRMLACMPEAVAWADVVHLTGTYSFSTIPGLLAARLAAKPLVWSPRGALQRWLGTTRSTAKAVWERVCSAAAPGRMALHVTSPEEAEQSRQRIPGVPAHVIPNGVELPKNPPAHVPRGRTTRLAFLGRLAAIKGLENLVEACRLIDPSLDWTLRIAGTGDPAYVAKVRGLIGRRGLDDRIALVGEVIGESKEQFFANSDLLILPSHSENFGMVVVEALARGVAVIASTGTPWRMVETVGCGAWASNQPQSLAAAVEALSARDLTVMGELGRAWIQQEFSWESVAAKMADLYSGLIHAAIPAST